MKTTARLFSATFIATLVASASLLLPAGAAAQPQCQDCGVVQNISEGQQKGQSSGVGAVAGGVLGGVLGHQIGSGRGNTVATIAGVGVGAVAGNEIEKSEKTTTNWSVYIRMDNGESRTFNYSSRPAVREGDHVKLVDGGKQLALVAN
jgi:outer membrane lipoprotein SlyB